MIVRCPYLTCDEDFGVSEDDEDATLTEIMHHLQGWPHYLDYQAAKELLPRIEEVKG